MLTERTRGAFEPRKVKTAYKKAFAGPMGKLVLAHIADTCGATETTVDENPTMMAVAEGRRQVWLAIQDVLTMSEGDLRELQGEVASYGGNDE